MTAFVIDSFKTFPLISNTLISTFSAGDSTFTGPNVFLRNIAVDKYQNIYLAGYTANTLTSTMTEIAAIYKMNKSGSIVWQTFMKGNGGVQFGTGSGTRAEVILVDSQSTYVYVVGFNNGSVFLLKLDYNSNVIFQNLITNTSATLDEGPISATLDPNDGSIVIAGSDINGVGFVAKYSSAGSVIFIKNVLQYTTLYGWTGSDRNQFGGVAVDSNSNIFAAGGSTYGGWTTYFSAAAANPIYKINPTGTTVINTSIFYTTTSSNNTIVLTGMGIDSGNNIYISGTIAHQANTTYSYSQPMVAKINNTLNTIIGQRQILTPNTFANSSFSYTRGVIIDKTSSNVYYTSLVEEIKSNLVINNKYILMRYSNTLSSTFNISEYSTFYNQTSSNTNIDAVPGGVYIDANNNIYTAQSGEFEVGGTSIVSGFVVKQPASGYKSGSYGPLGTGTYVPYVNLYSTNIYTDAAGVASIGISNSTFTITTSSNSSLVTSTFSNTFFTFFSGSTNAYVTNVATIFV